jgi:hypothetical protein
MLTNLVLNALGFLIGGSVIYWIFTSAVPDIVDEMTGMLLSTLR